MLMWRSYYCSSALEDGPKRAADNGRLGWQRWRRLRARLARSTCRLSSASRTCDRAARRRSHDVQTIAQSSPVFIDYGDNRSILCDAPLGLCFHGALESCDLLKHDRREAHSLLLCLFRCSRLFDGGLCSVCVRSATHRTAHGTPRRRRSVGAHACELGDGCFSLGVGTIHALVQSKHVPSHLVEQLSFPLQSSYAFVVDRGL